MSLTLQQGDALAVLCALPDASVHCCVTSPPYFGLREYGTAPQVWDDPGGCAHRWKETMVEPRHRDNGIDGSTLGGGKTTQTRSQRAATRHACCQRCGAWKGHLGLEPTPEAYVRHLVQVFREVKRVLRDDGTCWLNLGDSFGVGTNLTDSLASCVEGGVLCCGGRSTLTITTKREEVLRAHQAFPDGKFTPLFGVQRIFLKQRHNHLCQVLNLLTPESSLRIGVAVPLTRIGQSDAEIVLDETDHLCIVVTQHDLNADPALNVPVLAGTAEDGQAAFSIEEAAEPVAEGIRHLQAARDAVALQPGGKGGLQVHPIDQPVALGYAAVPDAQCLRNFRITQASQQHLALTLMGGAVELTFHGVRHLWVANAFGSLVHYTELYDKAYRKVNASQAKQELGIPDMVKRALMEDGWICRSTIIWDKPNVKPESVTDRPTKGHETVFLLAKGQRYFYDREAITEAQSTKSHGGTALKDRTNGHREKCAALQDIRSSGLGPVAGAAGRNKRSVWRVPTQPFSGAKLLADYVGPDGKPYKVSPDCPIHGPAGRSRSSYRGERDARSDPPLRHNPGSGPAKCTCTIVSIDHFATFPPALIEPMIRAGTSARGCCPQCLAPWVRVVDRYRTHNGERAENLGAWPKTDPGSPIGAQGDGHWRYASVSHTLGWRPTCPHYPRTQEWPESPRPRREESEAAYAARLAPITARRAVLLAGWHPLPAIPCTVLDPFAGAGTTGLVADRLGRDAILIELNPDYGALAVERWRQRVLPLEASA